MWSSWSFLKPTLMQFCQAAAAAAGCAGLAVLAPTALHVYSIKRYGISAQALYVMWCLMPNVRYEDGPCFGLAAPYAVQRLMQCAQQHRFPLRSCGSCCQSS